MTLTILFDLDDTLLDNNIDTFVPAYLKLLSKHLARFVPPERMVPQLLAATQKMVDNLDPMNTLEETFDQAFYPAIGSNKADLQPVIEQFYDEVFPQLQELTRPRPGVVAMVEDLVHSGHRVVIATNPIFPRKAILQRIAWAGFDPDQAGFDLITSYEGFHFSKPNPAYIAEILAQLGWSAQPAVMVGNNMNDDLLPAAKIGLPGFLVTSKQMGLPSELHPASASGPLENIPAWLETIKTTPPHPPVEAMALLAQLRATPAALNTLSKRLTTAQWNSRPEPDEWSLTEILCHMRDVDREVNQPRFEAIISENNPFIAGVNSDPWAEERGYGLQDGSLALQDFVQIRKQIISMLASLPELAWLRPARHAIFGPTNLAELVGFVTTHDCTHIQSFVTTANRLPVNGQFHQ